MIYKTSYDSWIPPDSELGFCLEYFFECYWFLRKIYKQLETETLF